MVSAKKSARYKKHYKHATKVFETFRKRLFFCEIELYRGQGESQKFKKKPIIEIPIRLESTMLFNGNVICFFFHPLQTYSFTSRIVPTRFNTIAYCFRFIIDPVSLDKPNT